MRFHRTFRLSLILTLAFSVSSCAMAGSLPMYGGFRWQVSLDQRTGIVSSKETSKVPKRSCLHELVRNTDSSELLRATERLIKKYPRWLCSFPRTFGILKAVPHSKHGYEIRSRVFNILFMSFGNIQSQLITYRQGDIQTTQCTVGFPLTGGCLVLRPPRGNDMGSLLFVLKKNQQIRNGAEPELEHECHCSLTTAVVGYRPSISGQPPVNPVRKWIYLSTQSLLHAHISWRFHRHLWEANVE